MLPRLRASCVWAWRPPLAPLLTSLPVQFIYAGKKATLTIGNVKPIGDMPEGTIVCNVESVSPAEPWQRAWAAPGLWSRQDLC